MVCDRCKLVVKAELEKLDLHPVNVVLGEVDLQEKQVSAKTLQQLEQALHNLGFELLGDKKDRLVENIKRIVIELVHRTDDIPKEKYSHIIADKLNYDYSHLSKLFSEAEGVTLEHYIINQKTERVKELLTYDELSLKEIAYLMGYSSVAHLSAQFKKVTGLTPSQFKAQKNKTRKPLDAV